MFLFKKHLSRRQVLKGAGATIALPLLDAMVPAGTALAQTVAAASPRLGFVYFPHGALEEEWTPKATGRDFDFPFMRAETHLRVNKGVLVIVLFVKFRDDSGRSSYVNREFFHRAD